MKNKSPFLACLLILAIIIFAASCGGGGGGGGGMVSFGDNDQLHNGGDAGGWGNGGYNGNGFGGNGGGIGSGDEGEIVITGSTPLNVTKYVYNGTEYSDVKALTTALKASGNLSDSFNVDFYVGSETTPRTARVTANGQANNGQDIFIEHQYKALFPADGGGTQEVLFYKRDGITLPGDPAGTVENGFTFETNWNIDGSLYPCGSTIGVAASGDVDFSNASPEIASYGFKEESGEYVLGFSSTASGDIAVHTNKVIKQVDLTSGGSMNLDLSGVTFNTNTLNPSYFTGTRSNLAGITLPSGLTAIGNYTFNTGYSNLETVVIPNSVTSIGQGAFKNCSALENISLGTGLQTIGDSAFYSCSSLESFTMPNSVQTLGERAFWSCSSLESLTLSNNLQSIPEYAFYACSDLGPDLNIPASVTEIGGTAFWHCTGIQNLTLNNGLQTLGDNAFEGCTGISSVSIPNTVTTIGDNAFLGCTEVAAISLPPSVTSIGDRAFKDAKVNCVLTIDSNGGNISLGGTLALPNSDFSVHLTGTGFPMQNAATSIFDANPNLTSVEIESGISTIPNYAFMDCSKLKNVVLPSGITTIGDDAFFNCTKLETINIPATVTQIKTEAFKNAGQSAAHTLEITFASNQNMTQCYLPIHDYKVVLKNGVPSCGGDSIFKDEQTLKSAVYEGGPSLRNEAFVQCVNMDEITFKSYPTSVGTNVLPDNVTNIIIGLGEIPITNVKDVELLFSTGRNFSLYPLTVTFYNDPSKPSIRINDGAFNFTGANLITYKFVAYPSVNMTYDNGDCFPDGKTMVFSSTNFTWKDNGSTGYWEQQP